MKKLIVLLSIFTLLFACKSENKETKVSNTSDIKPKAEVSYMSFGEKFSDKNLLSKKEIIKTYKNLKAGDTAIVKFAATVNEVCQSKVENLSSITIKLPTDNVKVPGIYYFLFQRLSWEGVNITEVISTSNEFTILMDEDQVDIAFKVIKDLKNL